jgi:serine-type D-Ala-D-Ala carboxypeptidase/endopeptidase (penicillin-binding protein 4)
MRNCRRVTRGLLAAVRCLLAVFLVACHTVPKPAIVPRPSSILQLQRDLDALGRSQALERGYWGVLVRSLANGDTLYAVNAKKLFVPASTLKTVTLAAAAERLGWDYSYETRIAADGPFQSGVVDGNIVVIGSGDPSIEQATVESWAGQLRALGIERITGDIVADSRAFPGNGLGAGWSWDDLPYSYAARVSAAQFHESTVDLTLTPGRGPGDPVSEELTPAGSGLTVENTMRTGPSGSPVEFAAHRLPGSAVVVLEGSVPAGGQPIARALAVSDPAAFLAGAVRAALVARGIAVGGVARARLDGPVEAEAATIGLLSHRSPPLRTIGRALMETSQNLYAETLLMTIGAQAGAATAAGGLKVVESVLASWGVPADAMVLRDGSGLSRYNYVTPEALVQVLTRMYRDPRHTEPFFQLLPIAGVSGTLAGRMKDTPAFQRVRAKTGSMAGVRSMCGIVTTADGEALVFAILANNFSAPGLAVTATLDHVVTRLAEFRRTTP